MIWTTATSAPKVLSSVCVWIRDNEGDDLLLARYILPLTYVTYDNPGHTLKYLMLKLSLTISPQH